MANTGGDDQWQGKSDRQPYSLVARARMLKDMCVRLSGGKPLNWQTNGRGAGPESE